MPIDLSRAENLQGWMSSKELIWLGQKAQLHRRIIELGSYLGRSTRILGENTAGYVVAIDWWHGTPTEFAESSPETLFERFHENIEDLIKARKVRPWRVNHRTIPSLFAAGKVPLFVWNQPDMVFVDGQHCYESCRDDIHTWKPRLRKGGLLCGHDYQQKDWPGVTKAVDELVPGAEVVAGTHIWWAIV